MNARVERLDQSSLTGHRTNIDRPTFLSVFKAAVLESPDKEAIIFEGINRKNQLSFYFKLRYFYDISRHAGDFTGE